MIAKKQYVTELETGEELLNEPFLLQDVVRRQARDGRPYLLTTLRDKTGQVNAIFWDVPDYIDDWLRPGSPVLVTGRVNLYRDVNQVAITDLNEAAPIDMAELLPSSKRSRAEMTTELQDHIRSLSEPWQALVSRLLLEEPWAHAYANAPAARQMHHAYIGGLLEHSLSMASLARLLSTHYPYVDTDLLVSGALLHDLGKAQEYTLEDGFRYSEDGRLVGHIVRAIVIVEQAAAEMNFPEQDLRRLVHLIASHHGTHEWGAPVLPKTLEAVLLHQIDLMDSRVQGFLDHVGNDSRAGDWTVKRSEMFGTELLRPSGFDDEPDTD
ncbi:MAG: HD domain-containing protein [Chloroflexota bacterium]